MIYLIGGPPKCGKTTLAKKLSKQLKVPWISADTLQSVAFAYTNKRNIPKVFPWSAVREKTKRSNDIAYFKYSPLNIIKFYRKQAKASFPAIEMVVVSESNSGNDYIIEGYQIEPRLTYKLLKKYGKKIVKSIFLVKTDKQNFLKNIKKSTTPDDWIMARTKNVETFEKIAEMICRYGKKIEKEAEKYNIEVFNMDNNFENQIREALKFLKHY